MIISLIGYMGSGKSLIAKVLSDNTGLDLLDLDQHIESQQQQKIAEIFKNQGEIGFRKIENQTLLACLNDGQSKILSLGGGTPCYYDNIQQINQQSISVFLQTSVSTLAKRLSTEKAKRPLIAHLNDDELQEFVAKHLFERNAYYQQAQHSIKTDGKLPEDICQEIMALISNI
jgi:shikimate kinase